MRAAKIIDRTILEIAHRKRESLDRASLCALANLIGRLGADFQELDAVSIAYIDLFPPQTSLVFQVADAGDADIIREYDLSHIAIPLASCGQAHWEAFFRDYRGQIMLEIECSRIRDADEVLRANEQVVHALGGCVRLRGLEKQEPWLAYHDAERLKLKYGLEACLSPANSLNIAGAICIEAIDGGADWITTSFCGMGESGGWAPLEEVIMASVVIHGLSMDTDTTVLSEAARLFALLTNEPIPPQKAVVGCGIFRCESGIHVDGLYKNPFLYEPYPPELTGQRREIVIGKHSGVASLLRKLEELDMTGIEPHQARQILDRVRKKSVELKRSLDSHEVRRIAEECCSPAIAGEGSEVQKAFGQGALEMWISEREDICTSGAE